MRKLALTFAAVVAFGFAGLGNQSTEAAGPFSVQVGVGRTYVDVGSGRFDGHGYGPYVRSYGSYRGSPYGGHHGAHHHGFYPKPSYRYGGQFNYFPGYHGAYWGGYPGYPGFYGGGYGCR